MNGIENQDMAGLLAISIILDLFNGRLAIVGVFLCLLIFPKKRSTPLHKPPDP